MDLQGNESTAGADLLIIDLHHLMAIEPGGDLIIIGNYFSTYSIHLSSAIAHFPVQVLVNQPRP